MKRFFLFFLAIFATACVAGYLASDFKSVSFPASSNWKRVVFANPDSYISVPGDVLLPTRTSCVMVQADGGDLQVADSTNFVVTVVGKSGDFPCEFSPIIVKDGNTLVINKPLKRIFVKGTGTATITSIYKSN
mgnify:CR=1 FL=1